MSEIQGIGNMSEIKEVGNMSEIQGVGNISESENKLKRSRKYVRKREQANNVYETCQKYKE
jgi:hypothetical protein